MVYLLCLFSKGSFVSSIFMPGDAFEYNEMTYWAIFLSLKIKLGNDPAHPGIASLPFKKWVQHWPTFLLNLLFYDKLLISIDHENVFSINFQISISWNFWFIANLQFPELFPTTITVFHLFIILYPYYIVKSDSQKLKQKE